MADLLRKVLRTRRGKVAVAVLVLAAVPLIVLAWWLASPLFINKSVDEEFPRTASAHVPAGMTRAEAEAQMAEAEQVLHEMSEAMPASTASAIPRLVGQFRDADGFHKGSGRATLYELADGSRVLRLEDLQVTNGPDLHVFLSAAADPVSRDEVKEGGFVDLGKLKGNIGNQNYQVPAGVDIRKYRSVVVYCVPFNVVFSVAPLMAGPGA